MEKGIEEIFHRNALIALILRSNHRQEGIEFLTPDSFSQQLAYMNRPAGYKISPHVHNEVRREVFFTQEVLIVRKGRVKIDFFSDDRKFLESRIVQTGDVILLASGGHGLEMLEQTEMIEVKQGPYSGDHDKTRFELNE
jgi:mannose-6-phosphate isomerase-like protein (cupin superfamily)